MFGHDFPYLDTRDINLDWLLKNMKTVVQQWTEYQLSMNTQFTNLTNAFNALKDWIDDYFENLDVSAEIEQKLDNMAVSGELGFIMRPIISGEVSDWLTEHITQPTDPVIDTSLTVEGAAADAKAVGDAINETIDEINFNGNVLSEHVYENFGHGRNYYNYKTNAEGYTLKIADGTKSIIESGYTSDYIMVEPSTVYNKRYTFNSERVADVVFYDSNRDFISAFGHAGDVKYFTTPANCKYIRICGYISNMVGEIISLGADYPGHDFYFNFLLPEAGGGGVAYMYSACQIIYNSTDKQLLTNIRGNIKILVYVPGFRPFSFNQPINVSGSGNLLYFNITEQTFSLSSDVIRDRENYLITQIGTFSTDRTERFIPDNAFIVTQEPIIYYDLENLKITIKINSTCYLWQNKTYNALTAETYDLEILPNSINCIYFNTVTRKFLVANSFGAHVNTTEIIPIGFIYGSIVCVNVPYSITSGHNSEVAKKAATYGDSLTWYDGHAFTWGEHEDEICRGYQTYLAKNLGMICTNRGISGASTPEFVSNRLLQDSATIAANDYIIIMPSIDNDDRLSVTPGTVQPIGGTFDDTTTAGALQTAIEYIYSIKPDARIIIMIEPKGYTYRDGAPHQCSDLYQIAIRNAANLYSIPIIDLWNESGINEITRNTYYADPTFESGNTAYMYHPNNTGWKVLSKIICEKMKEY